MSEFNSPSDAIKLRGAPERIAPRAVVSLSDPAEGLGTRVLGPNADWLRPGRRQYR